MLWGNKRAAEPTDIFGLVRVNDRVQLDIKGRLYASRVEDIQPGEVHVAVPYEQDRMVTVTPHQKVCVCLQSEGVMKSFPGVVKQILPARVPVMSVWEFQDMRILQRREYVRIADKVPVRFRKEERFNMFGPWSVGVTKDISGGGLQIVGKHSGDIAAEDFVEIELSLADGKPAKAIARVVRISSWGAGASNFAVQFVQIHPADRRQIVQYVMSRQSASIETDRRKKS